MNLLSLWFQGKDLKINPRYLDKPVPIISIRWCHDLKISSASNAVSKTCISINSGSSLLNLKNTENWKHLQKKLNDTTLAPIRIVR